MSRLRKKATIAYYRIGFGEYEGLDDLIDPDFVEGHGEPCGTKEIGTREEFETLENEYWAKEDAMYAHVISDEIGEIATGTAGMLEDWDIVEDALGVSA